MQTHAFHHVRSPSSRPLPIGYSQTRNSNHVTKAYTKQDDLIKALNNTDTAADIEGLKRSLRAVGRHSLDQAFDNEAVDIIVAPGDCSLCIHAAAAGYPIATVPLGQLRYNGRPFGLCKVAKENNEEALLRFMVAYESSGVGRRPVPSL
jgi:amidase